jgi:hypothetical protein
VGLVAGWLDDGGFAERAAVLLDREMAAFGRFVDADRFRQGRAGMGITDGFDDR